jgi:hypothetical protein
MEQPEGFAEGDPRQTVCLLQKSIYGTKQGGNRWNKKMRAVLDIQRTVSLLSSQSVALIFCTVKQVYSTLSSQSVAQRARQ